MNKIQSFSDIITNSSTEVFVITTNKHAEVSEFIKEVCDLLGIDMNEIISFKSSTHTGEDPDGAGKVKKGDLIIYGSYDNSIPDIIMDLIANLDYDSWIPRIESLNIKNVTRRHLG